MIERIRQYLWNRRREREIREEVRKAYNRAGRCNICGEQYVGMALDCKCTNWGKV